MSSFVRWKRSSSERAFHSSSSCFCDSISSCFWDWILASSSAEGSSSLAALPPLAGAALAALGFFAYSSAFSSSVCSLNIILDFLTLTPAISTSYWNSASLGSS